MKLTRLQNFFPVKKLLQQYKTNTLFESEIDLVSSKTIPGCALGFCTKVTNTVIDLLQTVSQYDVC